MESIRAPRGTALTARGWPQEAALRMLCNNLDPAVAERPQDLVVYGGTGKAARDWPSFHALVRTLRGRPRERFTPVLVLTTEGGEDMKRLGREAGATGWLVKPFDPDQLRHTVRRVLAARAR